MPNSNASHEHEAELIGFIIEDLKVLAHVVDDAWPVVETHRTVRSLTRLTANLFNALVDGNPASAGKALRGIDDIYTRHPEG